MSNAPTLVPVPGAAQLADGQATLLRHAGRQIALFRAGDAYYACDNRCPHEGYPLSQGILKDPVLTCQWHNWKFDLGAQGQCLYGGEDVRVYPVVVQEGEVFVDLTEEPITTTVARASKGLEAGLAEMDTGRMAREASRLLRRGVPAGTILATGARYGARHAEEGWDHGLATLTEIGRWMESLADQPQESVVAVTQALVAVAEPCARLEERLQPDPLPLSAFGQRARPGDEFRRRVESEDAEGAEALLRGAIAGGVPLADLERWMYTAALDHFLSYGHGLIFAVKTFQLLNLLGAEDAAVFLPPLVPSIVLGTREDLIPSWDQYNRLVMPVQEEMPRLFALQQERAKGTDGEAVADTLEETILKGTQEQAVTAIHEALRQGIPADALFRSIVLAAADRLLHFDIAVDQNPQSDEGWLDVTHLLTFANAARQAWRRAPAPETLRGLFQAARFIQHNRHLDLPEDKRDAGDPGDLAKESRDQVLLVLRQAVQERRPAAALAAVAAAGSAGGDLNLIGRALRDLALADPAVRQIHMDHVIKTVGVGIEETLGLGAHPRRLRPLLGAARYLASPRRERGVYRAALQALKFS